MVQHHSFDLDGTLLGLTPPLRMGIWQEVSISTGVPFEKVQNSYEPIRRLGIPYGIRTHLLMLQEELGEEPQEGLVEEIYSHCEGYFLDSLFSETVPVLRELRNRGSVSLLTYGEREFQMRKICACGIDAYVDGIWIVADPHQKSVVLPDIAKKFEVGLNQTSYVDDSPYVIYDIKKGCEEVALFYMTHEGVMSVGQERERCVGSPELPPGVHSIKSLKELL